MRVKTAGPGRQEQDVSYFHGLVRSRVEAITTELGKMREEMGSRAKNKATHQVGCEPRGAMALALNSRSRPHPDCCF
jgi:hypothetical protein